MSKKIKELELNALRAAFKGVVNYVLVEPTKVDAATDYEFRKTLRGKKITVKMVKNSFARKVLAENGVAVEGFAGTSLLCWGSDSVKGLATAVEGAIKDSKKDPKAPDKYKVRAGVAEGQPAPFALMKTMPTRLEAIGEVVAALTGPGSSLVSALSGPGASLASILKTIEEKAPAEAAAPAEAPPAA
ncbi:50S ribosomal protein L10 [Limnoglobus roseus]|uniref:Large ribosomal subunit protein uL10 n=1 Tax=Limnoglobus roseus TaxID=2598579 RepID=A0A5C1AAG0_9BACT|nr:50S ribosomal protein L10 [Limnoglobus roseus]QEL15163.1 50S ribosomal protein L10 [Limnoglobus roseus]